MKFKCVIIDDEPISRNFIERYCEKSGQFEIVCSFGDPLTAIEFLSQHVIDVLFLDVEMPENTGFQLLDQLAYSPKVILTSSKTEYAFEAFQYNVFDYLKKPVTYARFAECLQKLSAQSIEQPVAEQTDSENFFIKSDGKLTRLSMSEILYIESMGDYVKYFTGNKSYVTHCTLKGAEEKMPSQHFMKVHRSYIVNLSKIKDIQDNSILIDGKVIPISKNLKNEVMERIHII
jgi:DNA-binding LytR/AlgR family response regulator